MNYVLTVKQNNSISILGDALQVMAELPSHSFDACISDPPYNMSKKKGLSWAFSKHVTMEEQWDRFSKEDYFKFSYDWLTEVCRLVKPNGNIFVFGSYHNIYSLGFILQQLDRKVLNSIIWVKPNAQPNITCRMLTESTEQIIWAANETKKDAKGWYFNYQEAKKYNDGKQLRNYWTLPLIGKKERVGRHPSQKPESLLERLITIGTKPGDRVLDPFAGVGSVGAVCLRNNRTFLNIEKDKAYFECQPARYEIISKELVVQYEIHKPKKKKIKEPVGSNLVSSFVALTQSSVSH